MKVLLIRPWGLADEVIPPLGLGYLAAAIRSRHEVRILDALRDRVLPEALGPALSWQPAVVGLTLFSKELLLARRYLEAIKRRLPSALTLIGGAHPGSDAGRVFLQFPEHLDYAFAGEAETSFPLFLDARESGTFSPASIPGLIWRNGKEGVVNPRVFPDRLDRFSCAWDLIPPASYPPLPHGAFYRGFPIAPVIITRGCPCPCTFCSVHLTNGDRIRSRSLPHVLAEWELLQRDFGVKEFHIEDDNFTSRRSFVQDFCREIITRRWRISWTCPNGVRLDTLDETTLRLMRASGCYVLSVGIESGSDRVLKIMQKHLTTETIREKVGLIRRCGIAVSGFFLIGYPGEPRQELLRTFSFSRSLPLDRATYSFFQPFPGSILAASLPPIDLVREDLNLHRISFLPDGMTARDLRRLRQHALLRFYFRPRILWQMLRNLRSFRHLLGIARRAYRWLKA